MQQQSKAAEIITGMVFLLLCHAGLAAIATLFVWIRIPLASVLVVAALGVGLTQLIYAIPLCIYFKRRRRFSAMKGVIIGMILTFLLNGGCFGFVLWALNSAY